MRILITTAVIVARVVYAVLDLLPRRHKIVMLSRQADVPSVDFTLLADELRRRDPSLQVVVRCRFIDGGLVARVAYVIEVLVQMYHLATSHACVVEGYIVPVSILNHSDSLFVVQLWHALGAIKRFGYQTVGRPGGRDPRVARAMRMHRNYDVVLCGGPASVTTFAAAFDVGSQRVLPLGLPRVDYLRRAADQGGGAEPLSSLADMRARFPRLGDPSKTVVLYAPTFRWHRGCAYSEVIQAFQPDAFTLLIKPHLLESFEPTDADSHVIDATSMDILDLLPMCDVVVTDYSAVAFEAACIDKPVFFYVYDIDEYRMAQGLNLDPLVLLPDVSSKRIDELVSRIRALDYNAGVAEVLRESFVPPRDVASTPRIADLILSRMQADDDRGHTQRDASYEPDSAQQPIERQPTGIHGG